MLKGKRRQESKKYWFFSFLALLIFATTFIFYGCQFLQQRNEPVNIDEKPQDRKIGILKSLGGIRTSNQGTHLLQIENGSTVLLKSLQINLDDDKYINKTVEVRGLLNFTTDNKQIMEVTSIDVLGEGATQQTYIPSWKEYSNPESGIFIKYRDDLNLVESAENEINFKREFIPDVSASLSNDTQNPPLVIKPLIHRMTIKSESFNDTITAYIQKSFPELKSDSVTDLLSLGISRSRIGANSLDAYKKVITDEGQSMVLYFIKQADLIYKISLESGNDQKTLEDQNLFYEMLGSLKFTNHNNVNISETQSEQSSLNDNDSITAEPDKLKAVVLDANNEQPDFNTVSSTTSPSPEEETSNEETQTSLPGYTTLQSDTFRFSMQYPTHWYYSGDISSDPNTIRHYDFGTKPLDEVPGTVTLDILSGTAPGGSPTKFNDKTLYIATGGDMVTVYAKGKGNRTYKFSGPSSQKDNLMQMAGSLQE